VSEQERAMPATTEYDVSYFALDKGVVNPSDIQSMLASQASDGWRLSWVVAAGSGVLVILERPAQPPPPPKPSLGGFQAAR